jgi:lipopolysaccharide/colanic/teichoic acid biosynthesis glycosyltransferase
MRYDVELQKKNMRGGSPLVKIKDDPRVTRIGKIIRRFSIDELPEFFLVLRGDMSLVGPRPHLPEEVAQYTTHQRHVLHMKPGVTGLAQVSGRSDLTFEDEVRLDTFYMENWALWLDMIILVKTPFALIKKRRAL